MTKQKFGVALLAAAVVVTGALALPALASKCGCDAKCHCGASCHCAAPCTCNK